MKRLEKTYDLMSLDLQIEKIYDSSKMSEHRISVSKAGEIVVSANYRNAESSMPEKIPNYTLLDIGFEIDDPERELDYIRPSKDYTLTTTSDHKKALLLASDKESESDIFSDLPHYLERYHAQQFSSEDAEKITRRLELGTNAVQKLLEKD